MRYCIIQNTQKADKMSNLIANTKNHQERTGQKTHTAQLFIKDIETLKRCKELGYKSQAEMLKAALAALAKLDSEVLRNEY